MSWRRLKPLQMFATAPGQSLKLSVSVAVHDLARPSARDDRVRPLSGSPSVSKWADAHARGKPTVTCQLKSAKIVPPGTLAQGLNVVATRTVMETGVDTPANSGTSGSVMW